MWRFDASVINANIIRMVEQIVLQIVVPSDGRAPWSGYYWQTLN